MELVASKYIDFAKILEILLVHATNPGIEQRVESTSLSFLFFLLIEVCLFIFYFFSIAIYF